MAVGDVSTKFQNFLGWFTIFPTRCIKTAMLNPKNGPRSEMCYGEKMAFLVANSELASTKRKLVQDGKLER